MVFLHHELDVVEVEVVDLEHLHCCFFVVEEEVVFHDLHLDHHCCGVDEASHFLHLMLGDDLSLPPSQHLVLDEVVFYHEGDHHDDDGCLDLDGVVPYHEEVDQH